MEDFEQGYDIELCSKIMNLAVGLGLVIQCGWLKKRFIVLWY
jgi:hypothetical protein